MRRLISFDIDGTLEWGDPPGWVTMDMVRHAQSLGYIVGSASDRPVGVQRTLWERCGIEVAFTVNKHRLDTIKNQFEADIYEHIGDTNMDEMYARMHGFDFWDVAKFDAFPWMHPDASTSI
ncbi:MAG: HAD family hydrolase [Chloroflexi bacterium]|nr:HAD family hydrolase [Chloroflexota bacterium]